MALAPTEELEVDEEDLTPVEAVIRELTASCAGWVNLVPEVEPGHEPPPRAEKAAVIAPRGDAVPMATWTAPERPGGRATVGIQHGSGPKALDRLAEMDLGLAPGWLKAADHSRRGLVVTVPADAAIDDVVWWLLAASHALSTVPLTGRWQVAVYRR